MKKYSYIIRELREDKKFSQERMAEILNSTQRTVSHWERGETELPYDMLWKYAQYFKVSIDYLLGVSKDPHKCWLDKKP